MHHTRRAGATLLALLTLTLLAACSRPVSQIDANSPANAGVPEAQAVHGQSMSGKFQ